MYLFFGVMLASLAISSQSTQTGAFVFLVSFWFNCFNSHLYLFEFKYWFITYILFPLRYVCILHFTAFVSFTEIDRNICPVGFPGTVEAHIKSSFFRKVKSTIMICEHDSDCPNGKCCGILGENICLYFRGKTDCILKMIEAFPVIWAMDIKLFDQYIKAYCMLRC